VDDPAVADVKASLRDRDDIAKRGHPVLQRSPIAAHSSRDDSGAIGCRFVPMFSEINDLPQDDPGTHSAQLTSTISDRTQ
jgi:hypothetical protein